MKKQFKHAYIQDLGSYSDDILVVVGMDIKEIERAMVRLKVYKSQAEIVMRLWEEQNADNLIGGSESGFVLIDTQSSKAKILWLYDWGNDWNWIHTLVHEVLHIVQANIIRARGMDDEVEAQAYAHEYLFKNIRQELNRAHERWRKRK